ncbi:MAG: type I DNA topoisomerase [Archangium sp.]|nr:type I DNA topoisomerase [Archangium sp.]
MASKPLVIVESPAKAKTIGQFLGSDFTVMASVGHVVDLPSGSNLAVDVDNDFKLTYEVTKPEVIRDLKGALKGASELYLATDEDREGEAIAWHLREQLKPKVPVKRMVFHEITKKAIAEAVEKSRQIDMGLVEAQEARRTLDRLYGYQVSKVLWYKIRGGLSAGRVQSPAIRLIVQRELERMNFRAVSYWDVTAKHPTTPAFESKLWTVKGQRVASGKDFSDRGELTTEGAVWIDEARAKAIADGLAGTEFKVKSLETRPYTSSPKPPFMTSTLQQEGGRKLGMSAQQVMRVAQGLYEQGYITYMRTDSTSLSETALTAARAQVKELYGEKFVPAEPRIYTRKVKNAQEAHEAIRPAGESFRTPDELKSELQSAPLKLYTLIWQRTLASQMTDAEGESVSLKLAASTKQGDDVEFSSSGRTITFRGYLEVYVEGSDDAGGRDDQESPLPQLKEGDVVPVEALTADGHNTSPPARFTEASLVKKLEELGIGRPSTYASIIGTLQAKYVWKKGQALVPNWDAFAVVKLMEKHFEDLVDLEFTAEMDEALDKIASGELEKVPYLKEFYNGKGKHRGLKSLVSEKNLDTIDAAEINSIPIGGSDSGVVVKPGKYGPYIRRGEDTVSVPDSVLPDELTLARAQELLAAPKSDTPIGVDPATGKNVYVRTGRFGPYVQLGEMPPDPPKGSKKKKPKEGEPVPERPKTVSIFKTMKPETVTLEVALELLTLPRTLGVTDEGESVVAQNGRYGPYLMKMKDGKSTDSRNLGVENEAKLLTITLPEAMEIFKQPKQFRGRGQPKPVTIIGKDPDTGKDIQLKEGKFGHYVTDGETNASLRKGDDPGSLTIERALELMVLRREYMASPEGMAKAAAKGAKKAAKAAKARLAKDAKKAAEAGAKGEKPAKSAKAPAKAEKPAAKKAEKKAAPAAKKEKKAAPAAKKKDKKAARKSR